MKKLLLLLFLLPSLAFGQATGYSLPNFPSSGVIGTAAATVDIYSRININQTTSGLTLSVPNPTNTTTAVTEVWITNVGSAAFTLSPGGGCMPRTGYILKWTGSAWSVYGSSSGISLTSLSANSPLSYNNTTGGFSISKATTSVDGYLAATDFTNFNNKVSSQWITTGSNIYYSTGNVGIGVTSPLSTLHLGSTSTSAIRGPIFDQYSNTTNSSRLTLRKSRSTTPGTFVAVQTNDVLGNYDIQGDDGTAFVSSAAIRVAATGTVSTGIIPSSMTFQTANASGALTSALVLDQSQNAQFTGNITGGGYQATPIADAYVSSSSNWNTAYTNRITSLTTTGSSGAATLISNVLNIPNHTLAGLGGIGLTSLSGTSGVSYNSGTGAIALNLATANTWTSQQTATSFVANGTAGAGYMQLASQSSAPAAVSNSMIMYSDATNRWSLLKRNAANSADIFRTHIYPDQSGNWTYPTPASGSSSTLAGLETAQTFTQTNTFSANQNIQSVSCLDFNGTTWQSMITAGASTSAFKLGNFSGANFYIGNTTSTYLDGNGIILSGTGASNGLSSSTVQGVSGGQVRICTRGNSANPLLMGGVLNGSGTYLTDNGPTSLQTAGTTLESCTQTNATNAAGGITIRSGGINNASNSNNGGNVNIYTREILTGTGVTGSLLFDVGLTAAGAAGAGTKGGIAFFNNTTVPTWNSLQKGFFIGNSSAVATAAPTGGFYMYGNGGNMTVYGSAGGTTTIGTNTTTGHMIGNTGTPTIVAGAGAGTSPTVSITGTDLSGVITITTGTLPTAANAIVATITFNKTYPTFPVVQIESGNRNSNSLVAGTSSVLVPAGGQTNGVTTNTFVIEANTTGLAAATTYIFTYNCFQ